MTELNYIDEMEAGNLKRFMYYIEPIADLE